MYISIYLYIYEFLSLSFCLSLSLSLFLSLSLSLYLYIYIHKYIATGGQSYGGSKFSQRSQPFHFSTFANSHYSIPMAEATRPEKRMRKQTLLLDIATALGVPAEEARARMQTGGVVDFDELENDDDATPGARDRAMVITDVLGRMEEAETRITESQARLAVHDRQIKQLSNDVYKNTIRVAPARKTTVKQFHEAFDKIENELKQITAPKITNVKRDGL